MSMASFPLAINHPAAGDGGEMSCAEDGRAENRGAEKVRWGQHLVGLEQNLCMEQYLLKAIEKGFTISAAQGTTF